MSQNFAGTSLELLVVIRQFYKLTVTLIKFILYIYIDIYLSSHESLHGWVLAGIEIVNMSKQNIITALQLCNDINGQPYM
jgi:hypothetical protein